MAGPQAQVLRRTVEPIIESFVPVQMIDVPVQQSSMGGVQDQILQCTAEMVPEEVILVIEVPKISSLLRPPPPRRVLPVPQTAEHLVDVLTEPVYVLAVLASKVFSKREILGILSGQVSTASGSRAVDNPVPQGRGGGGARGGLQGSRARQNSTANLEQIVDSPARRGLPDFLLGWSSTTFLIESFAS